MSNETVKHWLLKFGRLIAVDLRCSRPRAGALASRGDGHRTCGSGRTRASPRDFLSGGCAIPRRRERARSHRSNLAIWLMPQDGSIFVKRLAQFDRLLLIEFCEIRMYLHGQRGCPLDAPAQVFGLVLQRGSFRSHAIRAHALFWRTTAARDEDKKGARFWTPGPLPLREVT